MSKIKKISNYTLYSIISLLILTSITLAAGGGTIGSLFEEVTTGVYKLVGTNIKNNTVGTNQILNNTITENDISDSFIARNADKLDSKNSTTIITNTDTTIPTSKAVVKYVEDNSSNINALNDLADVITTSTNLGLGAYTLSSLTSGGYNTAIGHYALRKLTEGKTNTSIGYASQYYNEKGNSNTSIGYASLYKNKIGLGNVALGYGAGYNELGSNKLYIDNSSTATPLIYGDFSTDELKINGTLYSKDSLGNIVEVITSTDLGNYDSGDSKGQCPSLRNLIHDSTSGADEYISYAACIPIDNGFKLRFPYVWDASAYNKNNRGYKTLFSYNTNTAKQVCKDLGMSYKSKTGRSGDITVFHGSRVLSQTANNGYDYKQVVKNLTTNYIEYIECVHPNSLTNSLVSGLILTGNIGTSLTIKPQWGGDPEGCYVDFTNNVNVNISTIPGVYMKNGLMFISKGDEMKLHEYNQCPGNIKTILNAGLPALGISSISCNNADPRVCSINY